jgi:hypothetical protein
MALKLAELLCQLIKHFLHTRYNDHDFVSKDPFRKEDLRVTSFKAVEASFRASYPSYRDSVASEVTD